MGNRRSSPQLSERQADETCELLVEMLRSREAARRTREFSSTELGAGTLRPAAEQRAEPDCACADLSQLLVEHLYSSGSVPEGNDVHLREPFSRSDADVMFQLGPLRGLERPTETGASLKGTESPPSDASEAEGSPGAASRAVQSSERSSAAGADSRPSSTERDDVSTDGGCDPSASRRSEGVLVTQESTSRPGFVLLRHQLRPECRHPQPLLFSPRSAVRLLEGFGREVADGQRDRQGRAGPSVAVSFWGQYDIDLVACVECPAWPSEEFASRQRLSGWPSAEFVRRLCDTDALLVPVGSPGSATQTDEWRLSFSRHEHAALSALTPEQRASLTALKYCKALLGRSVGAVKSYYLKTALLWLCERHAADWWEGAGAARRALLALLQWVEDAVDSGQMPCYFWSEVNLLTGRGKTERRRLARHIAAFRRHLLPAGMVLCFSRLLQWQRVGTMPADLVPGVTRLQRTADSSDVQLPPRAYRAILKGNGISLRKLQKLMQRDGIWPDEQTITQPPVHMNSLLAGYLLVNHGPRGVTSPRRFHQ